MANIVTNRFKFDTIAGNISLSADTWHCALVTSAITLSSDDQIREVKNWSELSAVEVAGTGYTANGKVLSAGLTLTENSTSNRAIWDANNLSWANTALSAVRGAVIYKDGGDPVVGFVDFGENKQTTNASFNLNWNSVGILTAN